MYQLALKAKILKPKKVDLLMLDEAGDINEVTLSIFQLLPAKLKILVGDNHQNIYSFNGTINGFEALKGIGEYYELTKSFRVSSFIAKGVEAFCKKYIDSNVKFDGVDYRHIDMEIHSHAYISRTNAGMIARMIYLDERHMQYNLVRPAKNIFELILILLHLKPNGEIFNVKYKFLQTEANEWYNDDSLKRLYPNVFSYIMDKNDGDVEIASAMSLLSRFGKDTIMHTYNSAVQHEKHPKRHTITLTTAHSSKGLEFDEVTVDDDMNAALQKILNDKYVQEQGLTEKHIEEFRLYYVCTTRCKYKLNNAEFIENTF
jgi:superfamily I DNA/RNA helicase